MSAENSDRRRLLGFAFANADFLVEIDRDGTVTFAAGAVAKFTDATEVTGLKAQTLFEPQDGVRFADTARTLPPGGRGRLKLKLKHRGVCETGLFHLPGNDERISCALMLEAAHPISAADDKDAKTGLATKENFLASAIASVRDSDTLTLVNVPALPNIVAAMAADKADVLLADIGHSILRSGAKVAGRLSQTSFGAVADAKSGPRSQIAGMRAAMHKSGVPPTEIEETQLAMKAGPLRPEQRLLAIRYVVERFASGDRHSRSNDLSQAFDTMMDETHERLIKLTDTVSSGAFAMAYQPIKNLKTLELSHFEALARFGSGQTGETISFVEKLGISDSFDLAVVMKVIKALESDTSHAAHVAFNVSGHTIQTPATFGMLVGLLARHKKLAPRLLIEITETAEITDTATAAKAIETLRAMGYRVGLDDFGAGAATLNYLQAFQVDFVKFDGSLVKKLGASARDDTMLNAMLKLCHELGFVTIAECLESQDDIARARDAGFDDGQGYALGAPGKIPAGAGIIRINAKRRGTVESWG